MAVLAEDPEETARDGGQGGSSTPGGSSAGGGSVGAGARGGASPSAGGSEAAGATTAAGGAHRILVRVILGVATVLAIFAIFAVWANRQLMNPTNWAKTSTALLQKQTIRTALSGYLIDQLYANVDVQAQLKSGLPPQLAPLAGPISGALHNLAEQGAEKALEAPRVQGAWENANRTADEALVAIVKGGGSRVQVNGGTVSLNLREIVAKLATRLGLPSGIAEKLPPSVANLKIVTSSQLGLARNLAKALHALALLLTILTFALYVLAMYLARGHRRRTLMSVSLSLVFAGLIVILGRKIGQGQLVSAITSERVDRTGRQRRLLGRHLAARAGRERLHHHRHPGDALGVVRRSGALGPSLRGASWPRLPRASRASPTGSPPRCWPSSSSGGRSRPPATRLRCCCSRSSPSPARMCCATRWPRSSRPGRPFSRDRSPKGSVLFSNPSPRAGRWRARPPAQRFAAPSTRAGSALARGCRAPQPSRPHQRFRRPTRSLMRIGAPRRAAARRLLGLGLGVGGVPRCAPMPPPIISPSAMPPAQEGSHQPSGDGSSAGTRLGGAVALVHVEIVARECPTQQQAATVMAFDETDLARPRLIGSGTILRGCVAVNRCALPVEPSQCELETHAANTIATPIVAAVVSLSRAPAATHP